MRNRRPSPVPEPALGLAGTDPARYLPFCADSHCDLVDLAGILSDPLSLVEEPEGLEIRERLAVEYTRAAMADSNGIPEALAVQLHEQFSDPELVELTFLIGYINMLNLFNNSLGVRYHGEYAALRSAAT